MMKSGFTEDDQARIAEQAVRASQTGKFKGGLGFGNAGYQKGSSTKEGITFVSAQGPSAAPSKPDKKGITGERQRSRSSSSDGRRKGRRNRSGTRSKERERRRPRRERARGSSRHRSRSRDRGRRGGQRRHSRSRSRSWSRGGRRWRRRSRSGSAERERTSRESRRRSPDKRHGGRREDDESSTRKRGEAKSKKANETLNLEDMTPAQLLQMKTRQKLQQASRRDAQLQLRGPQAGAVVTARAWERPEMADAQEFFEEDEYATLGGAGAGAGAAVEMRHALLRALEEEDPAGGSLEAAAAAERRRQARAREDAGGRRHDQAEAALRLETEIAHHDAIFAPLGAGVPSIPVREKEKHSKKAQQLLSKDEQTKKCIVEYYEKNKMKGSRSKRRPSSDEDEEALHQKTSKDEKWIPPPREEQRRKKKETVPLWKRLKVGDRVEARYSEDERWYPACVTQAVHAGFPIAQYKVLYTKYNNEETVSWKRIRLTSNASLNSSDSEDEEKNLASEDKATSKEEGKNQATAYQMEAPSFLTDSGALAVQQQLPVANNTGGKLGWKERKAAAKRSALNAEQVQGQFTVTEENKNNNNNNTAKGKPATGFISAGAIQQEQAGMRNSIGSTISKVRQKTSFSIKTKPSIF